MVFNKKKLNAVDFDSHMFENDDDQDIFDFD